MNFMRYLQIVLAIVIGDFSNKKSEPPRYLYIHCVSVFTNIRKIEDKISKGKDLFDRNIKYKAIKIDESFPDYITKNREKFKNWIM